MSYLIFDSVNGEGLGFVDSVDGVSVPHGQSIVEITCDVPRNSMAWVIDGVAQFSEPQPSGLHRFNFATKLWEIDTSLVESQVRQRRASILTASDWTQLPDVPLTTKEAWAAYRQALRDITEQPGYPLEVAWPVAPA